LLLVAAPHENTQSVCLLTTTTTLNSTIKMRTFFLFSLLVAAASAFVAPVNQAVGKLNL
jgi:hypothetical protein